MNNIMDNNIDNNKELLYKKLNNELLDMEEKIQQLLNNSLPKISNILETNLDEKLTNNTKEHEIFNKLNLKNNNILIFTTRYTIKSAELLSSFFDKLNFDKTVLNITYFNKELLNLCLPHDNIYFFFYSPQNIVIKYPDINLPKNRYYLYQIEQLNQNQFKYQNINFIENLILNSIYTFDYSEINLSYYPKYIRNKIKILTPLIDNNFNITTNKTIDILFIGTITERRKKILNKLKNYYNIVILEKVFNENLVNYIKNSKIILNIHAFNNSIFEVFRIHDILSYNCHIISEIPEIELNLLNKYKPYINFINIIDENLSNINELTKELNIILLNKNNLNNDNNLNKDKVKFIHDNNNKNYSILKQIIN